MKVVFAGPSLWGTPGEAGCAVDLRPPAAQGDVYAAVCVGANVIGLIDGAYEQVAATWHKEILFALAHGVQVFGGASIGALRAAECAAFGMIGVGEIYRAYAAGEIVDDAAVALLHGPAELGYVPLTEALVNVTATLARARDAGQIGADEESRLQAAAAAMFFKERTWERIIAAAAFPAARATVLLRLCAAQAVNQKQRDAAEVLRRVQLADDARLQPDQSWEFAHTAQFTQWVTRDHG
ncbi:hypothetical protein GGD81_004608 [Rhodobium orientis]|uniref:TfuA-like core domain-containing protein n=1 Tax=Rhodobium orientis TaxID=34017 RepID=A0A327JEA9_9HYPH|nr:TfuA-like protein [Rhodobium orientis]MBB4305528.1 hypothetical protein [Rhodobium orientis]MBK5949125.1 hypothetical protein [Rhodobium orientis]RAI24669.1 hypothetical protein CH339_21585 [Rhodobium orientis]